MIRRLRPHFDFLIIGGGFAGLVTAERICNSLGKTCLLVDKRRHIGGNCYDEIDARGVLIHKYGPHYFRTSSPEVKKYLDQFTQWRPANYYVKSFTDGRYWSFPINLNTFEEFLGRPSTPEEFESWLAANRVPNAAPANSEEYVLSQVGPVFYEKFFKGYTLKQWKKHPRELAPSVCGRIPLRTNRDDRYVTESFQAMPADGYTRLFENLVASCGELLKLELETDYHEARKRISYDALVYTGPIDAFFRHCHGELPYRSLRFEPESFTPEDLKRANRPLAARGFWQPYLQVNYPNSEAFTRIVEVKHITGQETDNTTIVREYPADYGPGAEPYYPVPSPASQELYGKYRQLSEREPNAFFLGRLASYRYYNMDQIAASALECFEKRILPMTLGWSAAKVQEKAA
jgi:UDP-galactopyranose mutase